MTAARAEAARVDRLWRRMLSLRGSTERNALVELYQPLAANAARRLLARLPRIVDPGDMLAAANVGLIAAIESFDPARGVPFESYCEWRLRGALMDELRAQDWLPRPWRARLARLRRAVDTLRAQLGREPFESEVREHLGWSFDELSSLPVAPPARSVASEEDSTSLEDVLVDGQSEGPGERMTREDLLQLVSQRLTAQECRVVYLKYWEDLPLREIGELEGLSESRVCKIHLRLLERLRQCFHADAAS